MLELCFFFKCISFLNKNKNVIFHFLNRVFNYINSKCFADNAANMLLSHALVEAVVDIFRTVFRVSLTVCHHSAAISWLQWSGSSAHHKMSGIGELVTKMSGYPWQLKRRHNVGPTSFDVGPTLWRRCVVWDGASPLSVTLEYKEDVWMTKLPPDILVIAGQEKLPCPL